jgi:3-hydroxyisobutyrate dehydrogenase-like beta-hydroxyacid dehydrogenase
MKAGFIGLGRMGTAMAQRALSAGHDLILFNRTLGKATSLVASGAVVAQTVGEAASEGGVVITMLANDAALQAVAADLLKALPPHGVHVAMGTHSVDTISKLAQAHREAGQYLVSAPVLGRPEVVTAGNLGVIVAGAEQAVLKCMPLLESVAKRVFLAGTEPVAAAAIKVANNALLGCAIEAMGEAYSLIEKCGAEGSVLHDVITEGMFACPAYAAYSRIISEKNFDQVGFTAALALKDANLALAAGEMVKVPLPSVGVWRDRVLGAIAHGDGERDWAVMALEQRRAAGLD